MDLSFIFDVPGWILIVLGTTLGASIVGLFYAHFKVGILIDSGADYIVQLAGYCVYKFMLCKIKDDNIRSLVQKDLDHSGNNFNEVWDKGIYGEKPKRKNKN